MRRFRALGAALAAVCLTVLGTLTAGTTAEALPTPVTRADLINYLNGISGNHLVSGIFQNPANPSQWMTGYHNITGQYPGLWASDFLNDQTAINGRVNIVPQGKLEWSHGSLVALSFHTCPPTTGTTCDWNTQLTKPLSDAQWNDVITDGTTLNTAFKRRLDEAAYHLQQFKDAGIPVLFRPVHEMNEGWAWWGGRPGPNGSRRLFQIVHDYLTNTKGLSNLVWVWNVKDVAGGAAHVADYWPGADYVDVVSLDAWVNRQPPADYYNALLNLAGGKPVALAEVGAVPSPATLTAQPRWAYFMVWSHYLTDWNTTAQVQATANDPRVYNQGEVTITPGGTPPSSGSTGPVTGLAGKCLDVAGAATANGTKVQLNSCNASSAQQWTAGADQTVRALGKCLDVAGGTNANGTKVQLWDCNGNGHQQWAYNTGSLTLVNPETNKCLDVTGQSSADGTQIQIWDCNGQSNQQWHLAT